MDDFWRHHRSRFSCPWPESGTEPDQLLRDGWAYHLAKRRVTEEEAEAASVEMLAQPPQYRDDHLKRLLEEIEHIRETRAGQERSRKYREIAVARARGVDIDPVTGEERTAYPPGPKRNWRDMLPVGTELPDGSTKREDGTWSKKSDPRSTE